MRNRTAIYRDTIYYVSHYNVNTELIVRIELTFVDYKTTVITIIPYKQMWTERESNPYNLIANQI